MTILAQRPPHRLKRKANLDLEPDANPNISPTPHGAPSCASPIKSLSSAPRTTLSSISTNKSAKKARVLYRQGYKQTAPSTPASSQKPYSLQTSTRRKLKPYIFVGYQRLEPCKGLTADQWHTPARKEGLISAEASLRVFQPRSCLCSANRIYN
ncbi:hypothetical protein BJ165DRAFT_268280 [Panaeolus papilionaceus]|nr:hypothetical protein BJ165DRAFT_268280 [Panaeolus papilionaceus]